MPASPLHESSDDRCPGALRLHAADDGHVARIRVPGGRLGADQLVALADLTEALGDGDLHLTSRANVQVRGLSADAGWPIAAVLERAGLLPSLAHDRVRNVVASPFGGPAVDAAVTAFDEALVNDPALTSLSGRFLFGIDDGSGDVLSLGPDLAVVIPAEVAEMAPRSGSDGPSKWQLVVDGVPTSLTGDAAELLVEAARRFLVVRDEHAPTAWRVRDLGEHATQLTISATSRDNERHFEGPLLPLRGATSATSRGVEGWVPLGVASASAWRAVAQLADDVILTPWRSVVLRAPYDIAAARIALQDEGFSLEPASDTARTTACIGSPGCGKALADVRRDAARLAGEHPGRILHISGCERRCGRPNGPHLDVVAGADGYLTQEC